MKAYNKMPFNKYRGINGKRNHTTAKRFKRTTKTETADDDDNQSIKLDELAPEILMKIIGYVNVWHHNNIRATSRRMRDVYDAYVMHEFNSVLQSQSKIDPRSYRSASLMISRPYQAIKTATEAYIQSGYESVFCGCLLTMMRDTFCDPSCPQPCHVNALLTHFFTLMDEKHAPSTQRSRLLFFITLMRLLKQFNKCTVTTLESGPLDWCFAVELYGPWVGIMQPAKRFKLPLEKQKSMLVIITEILLNNQSDRPFKRITDYENCIYIFGNDIMNGDSSTLTFIFTLRSTEKVCTFFHSCLEQDGNKFSCPTDWPRDKFVIFSDIHCPQAVSYGGATLLRIDSRGNSLQVQKSDAKNVEKRTTKNQRKIRRQ